MSVQALTQQLQHLDGVLLAGVALAAVVAGTAGHRAAHARQEMPVVADVGGALLVLFLVGSITGEDVLDAVEHQLDVLVVRAHTDRVTARVAVGKDALLRAQGCKLSEAAVHLRRVV